LQIKILQNALRDSDKLHARPSVTYFLKECSKKDLILERVQKIRTPMVRGPSSEFITERRFIGNNGDSKNDNRVVTVTLLKSFVGFIVSF
jgi:hypothetical protein